MNARRGATGLNNGDFTAGEVYRSEPAPLPAVGLCGLALLVLALVALYARRRHARHN